MNFVKKLLGMAPTLLKEIASSGILMMIAGFISGVVKDIQKDFMNRCKSCWVNI